MASPRLSLALSLLAALALSAPARAQGSLAPVRERGEQCLRAGNYACAETAFSEMIKRRPAEPDGYALRGIARRRLERYDGAVADLERAMDLGAGTWDIFSSYAVSLRGLGRTGEAIEWSYKTLSVLGGLVDIRGGLATMLVADGRHYEALALLAGFDAYLETKGEKPFFAAQRLSIEAALERRGAAGSRAPLRLPRLDSVVYAPVSFGDGRNAAFVVDTGVTEVMLPRRMVREFNVRHQVTRAGVTARLADSRRVTGDAVQIAELSVGPFALKNVRGFVCDGCAALLGQEVLSRFDAQTSRVRGVEFMALTLR